MHCLCKHIVLMLFSLSPILVNAQDFEPLFQIPASDIEVGESGILWSVLQTHSAFKIDLTTGNKLDSLIFNIPSENDGRGVAWDGTNLWYSEWDFDSLYMINPNNGNPIATYASPGFGPQGLAYGGGYIWHTDEYSNVIYKINPINGSVISTLPVPESNGWYDGIAYSYGTLWLKNAITHKLTQINASTGTIIFSIDIPFPTGADITSSDDYLYLSGDFAGFTVVYRYPIINSLFEPLFQVPATDIEVGDSGILWSVRQTHKAYKLDLTTGSILDSLLFNIPAENDGRGVAWDGINLWYSEWDFDKLYLINPLTGNPITEYASPGFGPQGLAYGGGYIWHTDEYSNVIYKINPNDGTIVNTISIPGIIGRIAGIAYCNGTLWLSNIDTYKIYKINADTGALLFSVSFPHGTTGDITCDNTYLYLTGNLNEITYLFRFSFDFVPVDVLNEGIELNSKNIVLHQNYPNPFNPSTKINYVLQEDQYIKISVLDLLGREIAILVNEEKNSGYHEIEFNSSNFSSGVYFYKLSSGRYNIIKKMMVMK